MDVDKQISALTKGADKMLESNGDMDTYYLALVSASLYNLGRIEDARKYADEVAAHQNDKGKVDDALTSITSSMGVNLELETTAIATIAWLND